MKDFKKLVKEALTPHYLRESVNEAKYRVEYTTQDGEKAKSRVYNSKKEADKKEKQLVDSGIKKAKVVKVEESVNENEAPVKVGDKLKMAYQGSTVRGKTGVVTSVSDDMAQVDFGGGDSYGILFSRIRGNEIINEDDLDKKYGKSFMDKLEAEIILKQQLGDLKSEREQIIIDMEQEAEPEGGKIADEYGSRLNDIDSRMKLIQKDIDDLRMYESVNETGTGIPKPKFLNDMSYEELLDLKRQSNYRKYPKSERDKVEAAIDKKKPNLKESVKMPSQKDVNDFFSDTFDEIHYLNSKPVEDWDEYDLSNWAARVRKSGPDYLGLLGESKGDKEIKALEKEAEKYPKTDSRYKVIQKKIGDLKSDKEYALPGSKADKKFSNNESLRKSLKEALNKRLSK